VTVITVRPGTHPQALVLPSHLSASRRLSASIVLADAVIVRCVAAKLHRWCRLRIRNRHP